MSLYLENAIWRHFLVGTTRTVVLLLSSVEDRDDDEHPTMHRAKNYLKCLSAEIQKP